MSITVTLCDLQGHDVPILDPSPAYASVTTIDHECPRCKERPCSVGGDAPRGVYPVVTSHAHCLDCAARVGTLTVKWDEPELRPRQHASMHLEIER